jgi:hypothetical protein
MAKGNSGRIVIDVDAAMKRDLYAALARDGLTMRGWFIQNAGKYMSEHVQRSFAFSPGGEAHS